MNKIGKFAICTGTGLVIGGTAVLAALFPNIALADGNVTQDAVRNESPVKGEGEEETKDESDSGVYTFPEDIEYTVSKQSNVGIIWTPEAVEDEEAFINYFFATRPDDNSIRPGSSIILINGFGTHDLSGTSNTLGSYTYSPGKMECDPDKISYFDYYGGGRTPTPTLTPPTPTPNNGTPTPNNGTPTPNNGTPTPNNGTPNPTPTDPGDMPKTGEPIWVYVVTAGAILLTAVVIGTRYISLHSPLYDSGSLTDDIASKRTSGEDKGRSFTKKKH